MSAGQYVKWQWAIRTLNPKLAADKRAIEHMGAGIGCYFLDEIKVADSRPLLLVGYKHFAGPLSMGSEWAQSHHIAKLDKLDQIRYPKNT
jgi:hypothetical protein